MNKTKYGVYWTFKGMHPHILQFDDLNKALEHAEFLRKQAASGLPYSFITIVGENVDQVGKPGVDSIKDGKCPDGVEYSWVKRRTDDLEKDRVINPVLV